MAATSHSETASAPLLAKVAKEPAAAAAAAPSSSGAKQLGVIAVAFLTYSTVSGGPVGLEDAVGIGGAFWTIIALAVLGIIWSAPQAFLTAELSTALPTNAGSVEWVEQALGWVAACCNSFSLFLNQTFDLPLLPVLIVETLLKITSLSTLGQALTKVAIVLGCFVVNIFGVDAVAGSVTIMTILLLIPFFLTPVVAAFLHKPFDWSALDPSVTPHGLATKGIGNFLSIILWNLQGWSSVGNLAAEIPSEGNVFSKGVGAAIVMVSGTYAICVAFGAALSPNYDDWQSGYLVDVGRQVAPALGICCCVAAVVASLSTYISSLASYSRSFQGMARTGILPLPWLGKDVTIRIAGKEWVSPLPALLLLTVTTAGLSFVDLSQLVVLDTSFANISTILTTVAFLRLRYSRPQMHRPFKVSCGAAINECGDRYCFKQQQQQQQKRHHNHHHNHHHSGRCDTWLAWLMMVCIGSLYIFSLYACWSGDSPVSAIVPVASNLFLALVVFLLQRYGKNVDCCGRTVSLCQPNEDALLHPADSPTTDSDSEEIADEDAEAALNGGGEVAKAALLGNKGRELSSGSLPARSFFLPNTSAAAAVSSLTAPSASIDIAAPAPQTVFGAGIGGIGNSHSANTSGAKSAASSLRGPSSFLREKEQSQQELVPLALHQAAIAPPPAPVPEVAAPPAASAGGKKAGKPPKRSGR